MYTANYLVEPSLDTLPVADSQKKIIKQFVDEYAAKKSLSYFNINTNNCILINGVYYQEVLYEAQVVANMFHKRFNLFMWDSINLTKYFANNNTNSFYKYISKLDDTSITVIPDFSQVCREYGEYIPDFITRYKESCPNHVTFFLSTDFFTDINYVFDTVLMCDVKQGDKDSSLRTINYLNSALGEEVTVHLELDKLLFDEKLDLTAEEAKVRSTMFKLSTSTIPTLDNICKEVMKQKLLYGESINFKTLAKCCRNYYLNREKRGF